MPEYSEKSKNDHLERIAAILCRALYRIVTQDITGLDHSTPYAARSSHFRLDFPDARSEGCEPERERLTGENDSENGRIHT